MKRFLCLHLFLFFTVGLSSQTAADYVSWMMSQSEAEKKGDYQSAIAYLERQIQYQERLIHESDDEYRTYGSLLYDLGDYHFQLGDYAKALECYSMAEPVYAATMGKDSNPYSNVLTNMSLCYDYIGDYERAISICTESLKHTEAFWGSKSTQYANKLHNLAVIYGDKGDHAKALEIESQVSALVRRNEGKRSEEYALTLSTLSYAHYLYGDDQQSIETATKALNIYRKALSEDNLHYASTLKKLSIYYLHSGDCSKAMESCTKAMEIYQRLNGTDHPDYADAVALLSTIYYYLDDKATSLRYLREAIALLHANILRQFAGLTAKQRFMFWTRLSHLFTDDYPRLAFLSHELAAPDLYDKSALFAKGLLLSTEMEMNRLIQESGDEEALALYEALQQNRNLQQQLKMTSPEQHPHYGDNLARIIEKQEQDLMRLSKAYGDFTRKLNTTWQEVQQALRPDEIAVEFLSFRDGDDVVVAALTLRKDDREPKFFALFGQQYLKDLPDTVYYHCRELTDLVWQPLQKELTGIHRIFFSPAGVLHSIGIEYAPGMEEYEMCRLSSTREVIDYKRDKDDALALTASLYGGIDYDAPLPTPRMAEQHYTPAGHDISIQCRRALVDSLFQRSASSAFNPLPGTKKEVETIKWLFDDKNLPSALHIGAEATETSLKGEYGRAPKVLHVATHGFFFTENQVKKLDLLHLFSIDGSLRSADLEDKTLTRTGLLMAGANGVLLGEDIPMEVDDGILTAQEIARLDLRGLKLVVLSACKTGTGEVTGEGVFGLQRAFKKAGAQTIVMSLMEVDDTATQILMTSFYDNLLQGQSKRNAFLQAQHHLQTVDNSKYAHPKFWAVFVMID